MWGRPGNIEAGARKSGTGNDAVKKYRKCVVVINLAHLTRSVDLRRRRYFAEMFRGHRGEREVGLEKNHWDGLHLSPVSFNDVKMDARWETVRRGTVGKDGCTVVPSYSCTVE